VPAVSFDCERASVSPRQPCHRWAAKAFNRASILVSK
jgi:hypothetical protein